MIEKIRVFSIEQNEFVYNPQKKYKKNMLFCVILIQKSFSFVIVREKCRIKGNRLLYCSCIRSFLPRDIGKNNNASDHAIENYKIRKMFSTPNTG